MLQLMIGQKAKEVNLRFLFPLNLSDNTNMAASFPVRFAKIRTFRLVCATVDSSSSCTTQFCKSTIHNL
eukprot:scaffold4026_cov117-Cylindrotheca_fusiformis.AAC.14